MSTFLGNVQVGISDGFSSDGGGSGGGSGSLLGQPVYPVTFTGKPRKLTVVTDVWYDPGSHTLMKSTREIVALEYSDLSKISAWGKAEDTSDVFTAEPVCGG